MKITIFISSMINSGGIERVVANLSSLFAERGHDVKLLLLRSSKESFYEIHSDVEIVSLNIDKRALGQTKIGYMWRIIRGIRKYICAERPDVMLAIWTDLAVFNILAGVGLRTKIIACEHTNSQRRLVAHERLRTLAYPCADAVVALTESDREFYLKMNKKSVLIPNLVKVPERRTNILKEKTILAIGTIGAHKGFDMLLDAWNIAHSEIGGWKLKIIGAVVDLEYNNRLLEKIREYELEHSVCIESAKSDIFVEYEKSSIFVLSSRREGLPMVIAEAMFMDVPVISFDCPTGPSELIKDGYSGILVANGNVQELAKAIIKLAKDDSLRKLYAMNAKLSVVPRFEENQIYGLWMKLFTMLKR